MLLKWLTRYWHSIVIPENRVVERASINGLTPVAAPEPIPAPDRLWSPEEFDRIRHGFEASRMEQRWHAYVEDDRLFLHRSWTGYGIYEAQFDIEPGGWRISQAVVTGDTAHYQRGNDTAESLQLLWLIKGVLLGDWDDSLWGLIQQHHRLP